MTISVPGPNAGIDAARGVRQDDDRRAQASEEQYRLDHETRVVALVEVEPALEHHDGRPAQSPEKQPADVTRRGRGRPARQLGERDRDGILDLVGQIAQPRTKHDPDPRHEVGPGANGRGQRIQAPGLLGRGDGHRRGCHGRAGLREHVQGEDGRGPLR